MIFLAYLVLILFGWCLFAGIVALAAGAAIRAGRGEPIIPNLRGE